MCPLCREGIAAPRTCPDCGARYHLACLIEFDTGCATMGCGGEVSRPLRNCKGTARHLTAHREPAPRIERRRVVYPTAWEELRHGWEQVAQVARGVPRMLGQVALGLLLFALFIALLFGAGGLAVELLPRKAAEGLLTVLCGCLYVAVVWCGHKLKLD